MRFELSCELKQNIIFTDYNRKILSYFKKALEDYNVEVYKIFYSQPREKNMSFACFFPIKKIENNHIFLTEKKFKIVVSIEDMLEAIHFYNAFCFSRKKEFLFGEENCFTVVKINKIREKEIKENKVIFKTLSPVLIREKLEGNRNWYHLLDSEKGLEILKKNLIYTLSERFSKEDIENLKITPVKIKKTVVHFYDLKFPASRGIFTAEGNPKILEHIYKSGFASRKSIGFGLLDIIA